MIRRISYIAFFASLALLPAGVTRAADMTATAQAAEPQTCTIKDAIDRFAKLDGNATELDQLAARKELLISAADCSKTEAEAALRTLANLKLDDPGLAAAGSRLAERLKNSIAYADAQKARVNDVGIRGTKDIARALKEWRINTYLMAAGNVANLDLWKKTSDLVTTAENRLRQIDMTLRALNLENRDEVNTHRDQAAEGLAEARTTLDDAKRALQDLDRPDEIAVRLTTVLNAVSQTYSHFFKISDEVKKVVPIGG